jgi:hypothetical protein
MDCCDANAVALSEPKLSSSKKSLIELPFTTKSFAVTVPDVNTSSLISHLLCPGTNKMLSIVPPMLASRPAL